MRSRPLCASALLGLLLVGFAAPADARLRSCGSVRSVGIEQVRADGIACDRARRKARRSQKPGGGDSFRGWRCSSPSNVTTCRRHGVRIKMVF